MHHNKDRVPDFGDMLERQMEKFSRGFTPGQKIKGIVTAIDGNGVFIDIGGRSEGILNYEESLDRDGRPMFEEGQEVEVFYGGEKDGEIRLTTRISSDADDSSLLDAWHNRIPVEGKVKGETNGGFEVEVGSHRGFCPYSQIDFRRQDAAAYVGQKYRFIITECDSALRNLVLSRRLILEQEQARMKEELKQRLQPGMVLEGTVSRLMPFGVFVDLGAGVDGLIHVSELSWGRNVKPEEVVAQGDRVTVMVREADWEKERISLSLRYAEANPWETVEQKYPVGGRFAGTVTKLMPFGAFVELEPGVEGLLHISKLGAGRRLNHPREAVTEESRIEVVIESVDVEAQRIGLGLDDPAGGVGDAAGGEESPVDEVQEERRKRGGKDQGSESFGSIGDLFDKL